MNPVNLQQAINGLNTAYTIGSAVQNVRNASTPIESGEARGNLAELLVGQASPTAGKTVNAALNISTQIRILAEKRSALAALEKGNRISRWWNKSKITNLTNEVKGDSGDLWKTTGKATVVIIAAAFWEFGVPRLMEYFAQPAAEAPAQNAERLQEVIAQLTPEEREELIQQHTMILQQLGAQQ